jgi:transposase
MASIIKKIKKGRPYYYAVESKRVDGKPRIVWQKYLGTIEAILKRTDQARPPKPKETVIFEAGGVAALLRIAQRLGLLGLLNETLPKREQGPSVGHYLLLAALNRALDPCSKLAIGEWYEATVLHRLWRFSKSAFSSQRFWDHMDRVREEDIEIFQEQLAPRIRDTFGIDPHLLLYDTTNFFTFLATSNDRADLPQRGHSKAKRHDLRQIGLALLVTRDFQVPLFHRTYPGNLPDTNLFPQLSKELLARYETFAGEGREATLVFDKGNVTDDAMERFVVSKTSFVAALSANRLPDLLATPLDQFQDLPPFPGTRAFATQAEVWGRICQVVVTYTESFFTQQLSGVTHNLVKVQKKLMDLEKRLRKWRRGKGRGQKPTVRGVKKSLQRILSPQFMKDLFQINVEEEEGLPRLRYALDHEALEKLSRQRLGRTLLVTDHLDWNPRQVVETYRSLSDIEETFKRMKNIHFLHWQPAYHWTDQKLKVHAFYCVLALLLATLARKVACQAGVDLSLHALLKELTAIREVAVIYPQGALAHRKDHITLSRMSPRQRKLAEALDIAATLGG